MKLQVSTGEVACCAILQNVKYSGLIAQLYYTMIPTKLRAAKSLITCVAERAESFFVIYSGGRQCCDHASLAVAP